MNKKAHYLGFLVIVFMMNACTVYQERNAQGFGGSTSWNVKVKNEAIATTTTSETQLQEVMSVNEYPICLNSKTLNDKQINIEQIANKLKNPITKPGKLTNAENKNKISQKLKEFKSKYRRTSGWSIFRTILVTIGTFILLAAQFLAIVGGGSGNYYEVAMIGALLLIFSIILLTFTILKSYRNLGFWGKLGFWLIPCGIFTIGASALLGIPLWIYGFNTGK